MQIIKNQVRDLRCILTLLLFILISLKSFSQTVPFQLTSDGHILVKATVDGKEGNFIFDTGGGINLFFNEFSDQLSGPASYWRLRSKFTSISVAKFTSFKDLL